jgi:hypothetical protein
MPLPHSFPVIPPRFHLQSITACLALLRSNSSSRRISLTPFLSSSKQTDFRNVASSRPHLGLGLIYAPPRKRRRRRRRRHLSYMRRCLHVQQQNYPTGPCSLCIQQSSDPHSSLTSVVSFAICSCISCHRSTIENKTHHPCRPPLTQSLPYFRRPHSSLQKAKQMHRCIQSSQARCASPKDRRPLDCSPCCYLKSEEQKGPQAHILGQRHDRRVFKQHES